VSAYRLKAPHIGAQDQFGHALALSHDGQTLAVTAYRESSNAIGLNGNAANVASPFSGAAYTFQRVAAQWQWQPQAYIKPINTEAGDLFGFSAAMSADGGVLAIGATQESSNATGVGGNLANGASQSGAVYLY